MAKSRDQIIGAFTLSYEGDGCLFSKYCHADSVQGPFTETCKRLGVLRKGDRFVGRFYTIWIEENNTCIPAMLQIRRNRVNRNQYELRWNVIGENEPRFIGAGMDYDGIMVGAYWNN